MYIKVKQMRNFHLINSIFLFPCTSYYACRLSSMRLDSFKWVKQVLKLMQPKHYNSASCNFSSSTFDLILTRHMTWPRDLCNLWPDSQAYDGFGASSTLTWPDYLFFVINLSNLFKMLNIDWTGQNFKAYLLIKCNAAKYICLHCQYSKHEVKERLSDKSLIHIHR